MLKGQIAARVGNRGVERMWAGGVLLLVPEAPLLAALVCLYLALGGPMLLGLPIILLIVGFLARCGALLLARMALEAAHYREAEALTQIALALYPWSADGLALRGALALAQREPLVAEQAFRQAITLMPDRPSFYAAWSGALLESGRVPEALAAAQQALERDPDCAIAHLHLAEAERSLGEQPHLVEDRLRAGLRLTSVPDSEAALRCALATHLLGEGRRAEAALTLCGAEALLPNCSPLAQGVLRLRLGELLIAQGQLERAHEHLGSEKRGSTRGASPS